MPNESVMARLTDIPVSVLCNADARVKILDPQIRPLYKNARIFGRARTCRTEPGQNGALHRAVHGAEKGDVLVVNTDGSCAFGFFGDILAEACQLNGVQGLLIDGSVRDVDDIEKLRFPVFCAGVHPRPTKKSAPGEINTRVEIGGAVVAPGDIIIGDADGVISISPDSCEDLLRAAEKIEQKEEAIRARLRAGETTVEIFDLKP